jgi:hypothetical protein
MTSGLFGMSILGARGGAAILLIAVSLVSAGCAKNDTASQTNTSSAATPMTAATTATGATVLMTKLPVYPGATLAAASTPTVNGKHVVSDVYMTKDPFDKVYAWYENALPAHAETGHEKDQGQESADFMMAAGTTQQIVSILKSEGVEVTNITLTVTTQ